MLFHYFQRREVSVVLNLFFIRSSNVWSRRKRDISNIFGRWARGKFMSPRSIVNLTFWFHALARKARQLVFASMVILVPDLWYRWTFTNCTHTHTNLMSRLFMSRANIPFQDFTTWDHLRRAADVFEYSFLLKMMMPTYLRNVRTLLYSGGSKLYLIFTTVTWIIFLISSILLI